MSKEIFESGQKTEESWIATSDLMAGLMMIFLLLLVMYITKSSEMEEIKDYNEQRILDMKKDIVAQNKRLKKEQEALTAQKEELDAREREQEVRRREILEEIGRERRNLEGEICQELKSEFADAEWRDRIQICEDALLVRFNDPDTLFELGKDVIRPSFRVILADFFPRYVEVLDGYFEEIDEVRIEGHTDDIGFPKCRGNSFCNYFENMKLSQDRTRSVMDFVLRLREVRNYENWLIKNMTANGLSSSHLIYYDEAEGSIDRKKSRRVEFVIRLKEHKSLREIERGFDENR